jgi:hypothetical protein
MKAGGDLAWLCRAVALDSSAGGKRSFVLNSVRKSEVLKVPWHYSQTLAEDFNCPTSCSVKFLPDSKLGIFYCRCKCTSGLYCRMEKLGVWRGCAVIRSLVNWEPSLQHQGKTCPNCPTGLLRIGLGTTL